MSDQDRWTVDLTDVAREVRRVSRHPAQRVCRGDNVMSSLQQPLDDASPARRVCESPVYENDRRFVTHLFLLLFSEESGTWLASPHKTAPVVPTRQSGRQRGAGCNGSVWDRPVPPSSAALRRARQERRLRPPGS